MRRVKKILVIGAIAIFAALVMGFIVMTLWNWLAPEVFGFHEITFGQALGLLILCKILFGGFRGRSHCGGSWKRRMSERWQQMTPEEREKFRSGLFSHCEPHFQPRRESASGENI